MSSRFDSVRKLSSMTEIGVATKQHPIHTVIPISLCTQHTMLPAISVHDLTTRKLVPSAVRWPTPARMKPVTVSSSPITATSLDPSALIVAAVRVDRMIMRVALVASRGLERREAGGGGTLAFATSKMRSLFLPSKPKQKTLGGPLSTL
jgi:hypothetical protein